MRFSFDVKKITDNVVWGAVFAGYDFECRVENLLRNIRCWTCYSLVHVGLLNVNKHKKHDENGDEE